jgi:hypothetical protein
MSISLLPLIPLLGAAVVPVVGRAGRNACVAATGGVTLLTLLLLFLGVLVQSRLEWLPQVGLAYSVFVDGLGLFFAAMILVIGLLVTAYARAYLAPDEPAGRFFAYLRHCGSSIDGRAASAEWFLVQGDDAGGRDADLLLGQPVAPASPCHVRSSSFRRLLGKARDCCVSRAGADGLAGARIPVAFFAYPGKPSLVLPNGCEEHVLARPEEDIEDALRRLAEAVNASAELAPITSPSDRTFRAASPPRSA